MVTTAIPARSPPITFGIPLTERMFVSSRGSEGVAKMLGPNRRVSVCRPASCFVPGAKRTTSDSSGSLSDPITASSPGRVMSTPSATRSTSVFSTGSATRPTT